MTLNIQQLAWEKMQGLLPIVVQDAKTSEVLMLGYMNQEALQQTLATKWVTFYSRSKNRLWMKGEVSGNRLKLIHITADCDQDTLLALVEPTGPVCHTGTFSCFGDVNHTNHTDWVFIQKLEGIIAEREHTRVENSYVVCLFNEGISKIAQKVGEEAVEVALASINKEDEAFCGEAADLLFHLLILLRARKLDISKVIEVLKTRSIK